MSPKLTRLDSTGRDLATCESWPLSGLWPLAWPFLIRSARGQARRCAWNWGWDVTARDGGFRIVGVVRCLGLSGP